MIAASVDTTLLVGLFWEKKVYLKHDKGGQHEKSVIKHNV